jgi:hypothetical protein
MVGTFFPLMTVAHKLGLYALPSQSYTVVSIFNAVMANCPVSEGILDLTIFMG